MAQIRRITQSFFQRKPHAPGDSLITEAVGLGGGTVSVELYGQAGLVSRPPKGSRIVSVPVGKGSRTQIAVACHNYAVNFVIAEGETTIFSTSPDGKTINARIDLDGQGKVKISNATKSLKTILDSLISHLSALATIPCVPGSPVTLAPGVIAQLAQDKADLALLLKD